MLTPALGTVISWNAARGFGFVRADRGGDEFFIGRRDLLRRGIQNLAIGQRVAFDPARDGLSRRAPRAVNIRVVV